MVPLSSVKGLNPVLKVLGLYGVQPIKQYQGNSFFSFFFGIIKKEKREGGRNGGKKIRKNKVKERRKIRTK